MGLNWGGVRVRGLADLSPEDGDDDDGDADI